MNGILYPGVRTTGEADSLMARGSAELIQLMGDLIKFRKLVVTSDE